MRDGIKCTKPTYALVIETEALRETAMAAGAAGFGITPASPFTQAQLRLNQHREHGLAGSLHFTYDDPTTATDVSRSFPWARSLVVFSHHYSPRPTPQEGAVVASFATRNHYLDVEAVAVAISSTLAASGYRAETLIDDNRLVDRAAAARAGVGWLGKSTMALSPQHGPWLLLGTVVTDADLEPTPPMSRTCGTCAACIPACPTDAITSMGLDARRCIAAWLQSPGSLPRWIRPHIGRRIYGCDDCLTSCPPGHKALGIASAETPTLSFSDLLALTDQDLVERFDWWYVPRRDGRYLRRNLLVAAGNSREKEAIGAIQAHISHPSSMIRGHAVWGLARALGEAARDDLEEALELETVPEAASEIEHALAMIDCDEP